MGFEPTNPYGTAASGQNGAQINWEIFETWLSREYLPIVAVQRLRYAKKYADCLLNRDFSSLKLLTECKRQHTLKGLAALAKFLGVYELFKSLVKNYGLKWGGKNSDDLIIKRLLKAVDPNEVFDWIKEVKRNVPEMNDFMDLMAITGLRYNEAIESYNLIVKLASEGKLNEYFNAKKQVLEHYRFKEIFVRRSKKVFISFVPIELVQRISHSLPFEWNATKKKVARKVGNLRFADIREVIGSILTRNLSQPEIDFLQGRVSASVFMRHYFNPAWITDLQQRALKAAEDILRKIN